MKNILLHFREMDWAMVLSATFLVAIGLVSIYSSSIGKQDFFNFEKQLIFFIIGFLLMIIFSFFDWRILSRNSYLILILYLICLISLAGLFFFAPAIRNVRSWYKIGPLSIDPIEFTKIILIILLAKYFSMRHVEMYNVRHILVSSIYLLTLSALAFLQPDLGSVFILVAIWIGILIISGIKMRHFLSLILIFLLILSISWLFFLKEYQKQRISSFFQPKIEPLGISWSQSQSKIAIGSGGHFGQGLFHGSQTQYGFLPEPQTDFIFAAIAEEMGLVGVMILLFLFAFLIWRIIKIAFSAETNFTRLFSSGLIILLISQIFINIGMNLGLLPIIGISLPLISYGGSSLISIFIGFGILQSIKTH